MKKERGEKERERGDHHHSLIKSIYDPKAVLCSTFLLFSSFLTIRRSNKHKTEYVFFREKNAPLIYRNFLNHSFFETMCQLNNDNSANYNLFQILREEYISSTRCHREK